MSNGSNESKEHKEMFLSVLKDIKDKCLDWKNKLTEVGLEDNADAMDLCSFLGHVLTQVESKLQDCDKVDSKVYNNLTEVVEEKVAVLEAKKKAKKKGKGEDSEKRQRLTFEEMFQKWKVYCRENETTTIPKAESKLSGWVHDQRKAWRKLLNKQKTTMTTERVRQLSLAGFIFDPTTTTAEISTPKTVIGKNPKATTPKSTPTAKAASKSSDKKVTSMHKPTPKSSPKPEKKTPENEKITTPKSSDQKVSSKKKPTPKSTPKPEKKTPENERKTTPKSSDQKVSSKKKATPKSTPKAETTPVKGKQEDRTMTSPRKKNTPTGTQLTEWAKNRHSKLKLKKKVKNVIVSSVAAVGGDNNNKPIIDLIEESTAQQASKVAGVSTRGKKRSNEVAQGESFTCCDGKYCLMPEDQPVVGKHKCATCKKTLHEHCGVLVEGSTSFLESRECHNCTESKEMEPKQKKQRKKKEVVENEEVEKVICKDVTAHLHEFTEGLSAEEKLVEICSNRNCTTSSRYRYDVAFFVDDQNNNFGIKHMDFYKYKTNSFTSCDVISGYFYLLDKDLGGGENKFFSTQFFKTCIEDATTMRKMTEFKNKFKTIWKKLFFPINVNSNHWILLTIDKEEKAVKVFDSLGKKNEYYTSTLMKLVNKIKKKDEQWVVLDNSKDDIQRQIDSVSCGWFTCWYAYQIATTKSVARWEGDYNNKIKAIERKIML